jgi:hypothetical protein
MSTCCSLKRRSSSYHMPGIGFLYPSLAHAANTRNGTSGNCRERVSPRQGMRVDERTNETGRTALAMRGNFFFQSPSAVAWRA